jgi:hypothetical protein
MGGDAIVFAARSVATGSGGWCGSTRSARSATNRRQRPRTSVRSSRRSARTSGPRWIGSPATCSRRARTGRWSIASPETWPRPPGRRARLAGLRPQPTPADPRCPRRAHGADRRHQPRRRSDRRRVPLPARRRAGRADGRRALPDARGPRAVQPGPRRDARLVLPLTRAKPRARLGDWVMNRSSRSRRRARRFSGAHRGTHGDDIPDPAGTRERPVQAVSDGHVEMGRAGLEPATLGLKVPCSTS